MKHCLHYIKGTQHYHLHLCPQPPPGIRLPLAAGQQIPLLIECYSDSDWAGDINTRQSTSGSLVTPLKNNMHSTSNTTGHRHQLNHLRRHPPQTVHQGDWEQHRHQDLWPQQAQPQFVILLLQQAWFNAWGSTKEQNILNFFLWIQDFLKVGWSTCSSSCFNRDQSSRCFHQDPSSCSSSMTSCRPALGQQLHPQQVPQVVQVCRQQVRPATTTDN